MRVGRGDDDQPSAATGLLRAVHRGRPQGGKETGTRPEVRVPVLVNRLSTACQATILKVRVRVLSAGSTSGVVSQSGPQLTPDVAVIVP